MSSRACQQAVGVERVLAAVAGHVAAVVDHERHVRGPVLAAAAHLEQVGRRGPAAGQEQEGERRRGPPHTTTRSAPATSRRKRGVESTPSSRASTSARSVARRLDRRRARPDAAVLQLDRRVAQLGERARERLTSGVGHVGRGLGTQRAGHQAVVEQRRERAEADQRARRAAVGGGRDQQRQPGVQALQVARLEDDGDHVLIVRTLDARGLNCPLPLIRARRELAGMADDETLVVLATDPEAPIDLAALAADEGHAFAQEQAGAEWRITLTKGAAGR